MSETLQKLPAPKTYADLRREVRLAIRRGKEHAAVAVEQEKVRTSWEIGKLIDAHVLQHKERAGYAQFVLVKLAKDLGTSRTELYYMLEFARTHPIVRSSGQLTWAHYKRLLAINNDEKRQKLALRAEKENWSSDQLRREIQKSRTTNKLQDENFPEILTAQPGVVGCYRIIQAAKGPYQGELAVDLGFSNYLRPAKLRFKEGDIVETYKGKLRKRKGGIDANLFTYEAYLIEVVDGDTFNAVIDLGFGITSVQTLRLRGLDAPEIATHDGINAAAFVKRAFAKSAKAGMTSVILKSIKSDKYDRYLADVFLDGVYLNQQLVSRSLATVMEV